MTDLCDPNVTPPPSVIQAWVGDDWGWAFTYTDSAGTIIDADNDTVEGELYLPYVLPPYDLNEDNGRVYRASPPWGQEPVPFAMGLEKEITETIQADPNSENPMGRLRVIRVTPEGLRRTVAEFVVLVLKGNDLGLTQITPPRYQDPVNGDIISMLGYTNVVPAPGGP